MGKSHWSLEEIIDSLSDIVDLEIWDSASRLFPYLNRRTDWSLLFSEPVIMGLFVYLIWIRLLLQPYGLFAILLFLPHVAFTGYIVASWLKDNPRDQKAERK